MADPTTGPTPPNQQRTLPRLYKGKRFAMRRDHHLNGDIPTYWGPNQDAPDEQGDYAPPANWPRKGTLLRVPRVARWFWEAADVQTEVVIALGLSGVYSYGVHFNSRDVDITTPPGIFPVHDHSILPAFAGIPIYAVLFTTTYTGHLDWYNGEFNVSGNQRDWFAGGYLPPFILEEYEDRTSDTYKVVSELWHILSDSFIPAKPATYAGIPPVTGTPDGPFHVGVTPPIKTGVYYVNGIQYGQEVDTNTIGLSIPIGWTQPPQPNPNGDASSNWAELSDKMNAAYKGSTNPYFNAFPKPFGIDNFLDIVTPVDDGFFGTHCVNFITLSTTHKWPTPDDARCQRIKLAYPHIATYVVVVMLDLENLNEQAQAGDSMVPDFISGITALVASLSAYGWFLEDVSYLTPETTEAIIKRYIATYLKPELNDAPPREVTT